MCILSKDHGMELQIIVMKNYRKYTNNADQALQFWISPESLKKARRKLKNQSYYDISIVYKDLWKIKYELLKGKFIIILFSV